MKKLLLLLAVLTLTGCTSVRDMTPLIDNLSGAFVMCCEYKLDGVLYSADFEHSGYGTSVMTLLSPHTVAGYQWSADGGVVTLSHRGYEKQVPENSLTKDGVFARMLWLLSRIGSFPDEGTETESGVCVSFEGVTVYAVNGVPQRIVFPQFEILITAFEKAE